MKLLLADPTLVGRGRDFNLAKCHEKREELGQVVCLQRFVALFASVEDGGGGGGGGGGGEIPGSTHERSLLQLIRKLDLRASKLTSLTPRSSKNAKEFNSSDSKKEPHNTQAMKERGKNTQRKHCKPREKRWGDVPKNETRLELLEDDASN